MATELNFTARLDTSQFLSQIDQARTQFGLAFSGGGLGQQFQQMAAGLGNSQSAFGGTFTNPSIAYSPFFGAVQATTQLDQEWAVHRGGYTAAMMMKPPGVSAATYAMGVESNFIDRQIDASSGAATAGAAALHTGIGGMVGGSVAGAIGGAVGSRIGAGLATRVLGAGATNAGRFIGGLAGNWMAFDYGMELVAGKIQDHYAEVEKIGGYTRELGELAGAGRGLNRTERYELGIAARGAAGDLKMDVQEMGEILALGRQSGMLPTATDPSKAREQYREFAKAIEEGAQILGTSLAGATQVIKAATGSGMSAREGALRAAAAGGPEEFMGQLAQQAAQRSMINSVYQGMAGGPIGNMQLMAAMGGGSLNMSMYDLPGAAMNGLMAGGGDFMSNAARFMVHRDEYMRGMGPGGAPTMARAQIQAGGEMIQTLAPNMSNQDAQSFFLMSQGLDPRMARTVAGGGGGGSRGLSGDEIARAIIADQNTALGIRPAAPGDGASSGGGISFNGAVSGALLGASLPVPGGAVVGAIGGFAVDNWSTLKGYVNRFANAISWDDIKMNSTVIADRRERAKGAEYEAGMTKSRAMMGIYDVGEAEVSRFMRADLRGARLDLDDAGSSYGSMVTAASLMALGLRPVDAGPGTIRVNNMYFNAPAAQKAIRKNLLRDERILTQKENDLINNAIAASAYGEDKLERISIPALTPFAPGFMFAGESEDRKAMRADLEQWWGIMSGNGDKSLSPFQAALNLREGVDAVIDKYSPNMDPKTREYLKGLSLSDKAMLKYVSGIVGKDLNPIRASTLAGLGVGAAMATTEIATQEREQNFLASYGGIYADKGFTKAMMMDERMGEVRVELLKGTAAGTQRANELINQVGTDTQVKLGDKFRYGNRPVIDVEKAMIIPDASDIEKATKELSEKGMDPKTIKEALSDAKWSYADEVRERENPSAMSDHYKEKAGKRRSSPAAIEKKIGFGEQESAMEAINRSLRSTERALKDLSDQIKKDKKQGS